MARQEQDREDLLREATALIERIEFRGADFPDPIVIGFRRTGEGSIFIGADPVFQFNSHLELRRGFFHGQLLKAEKGTLVALERQRTVDEVLLLRTELTAPQTEAVMSRLYACLATLRQTLSEQRFTVVGQVPPDVDVLGRVVAWLNLLPEKVTIAAVPNVR
jgi:hypothetical protein